MLSCSGSKEETSSCQVGRNGIVKVAELCLNSRIDMGLSGHRVQASPESFRLRSHTRLRYPQRFHVLHCRDSSGENVFRQVEGVCIHAPEFDRMFCGRKKSQTHSAGRVDVWPTTSLATGPIPRFDMYKVARVFR
jgi:hypothetical protein